MRWPRHLLSAAMLRTTSGSHSGGIVVVGREGEGPVELAVEACVDIKMQKWGRERFIYIGR